MLTLHVPLPFQVVFQEQGFASLVMLPPAVLSLRWHAAANPSLPANTAGEWRGGSREGTEVGDWVPDGFLMGTEVGDWVMT